MTITLAFDVYDTIIDTSGVITELETVVGNEASALAQRWREKQLEYSFRRALMQNYQDFSVCTHQALEYVCQSFQLDISSGDKARLMEMYKVLPSHPEVKEALSRLKASGYRMYAFSNGRAEDVQSLVDNAGIANNFDGIVSTEDIKSFKPDPAVYSYFLRQSGARSSEAWLVSSNPFDVIGAVSFGISAAWVKRSAKAIFDPWDIQPTITVGGITELDEALS